MSWKKWITDKRILKDDYKSMVKEKKIELITYSDDLVIGHIRKADHNLKFTKLMYRNREFNDWAIVGIYYSIYHASLALCASKSFLVKDHNAALLLLIKEFYKSGLDEKDINQIASLMLQKDHILLYVESKSKRRDASYSTNAAFDNSYVDMMRLRAIDFVNKSKDILGKNL